MNILDIKYNFLKIIKIIILKYFQEKKHKKKHITIHVNMLLFMFQFFYTLPNLKCTPFSSSFFSCPAIEEDTTSL